MKIEVRRALTAALAALAVGLAVPGGASAEDAPDLARGEVLFDLCSQCHGAQGEGNEMFLAPAIAGLGDWYIEAQLKKFRGGLRGTHVDDITGMRMRPMSLSLRSDEDVTAVSAYAASLPPRDPTPTLAGGDATRGAGLFAICAACHGQKGEGIQAMNAPPLVHLNDWYLLSILQRYKAGVLPRPGDAIGVLMGPQSPASITLTDEQAVRDVVAHIMTLSK